jgi:5-methylcytosine-specific restriction endonuclease McrA
MAKKAKLRSKPVRRRSTRIGKTSRVPKTRCSGKWTEAAFLGFIRSGLRQMSRRWRPLVCDALNAARRKSKSKKNLRLKWQYNCAHCKGWFSRKNVEVNHIIPCGSMSKLEDLPGFVARLFCEVDNLEVVCKKCHLIETKKQKLASTRKLPYRNIGLLKG